MTSLNDTLEEETSSLRSTVSSQMEDLVTMMENKHAVQMARCTTITGQVKQIANALSGRIFDLASFKMERERDRINIILEDDSVLYDESVAVGTAIGERDQALRGLEELEAAVSENPKNSSETAKEQLEEQAEDAGGDGEALAKEDLDPKEDSMEKELDGDHNNPDPDPDEGSIEKEEDGESPFKPGGTSYSLPKDDVEAVHFRRQDYYDALGEKIEENLLKDMLENANEEIYELKKESVNAEEPEEKGNVNEENGGDEENLNINAESSKIFAPTKLSKEQFEALRQRYVELTTNEVNNTSNPNSKPVFPGGEPKEESTAKTKVSHSSDSPRRDVMMAGRGPQKVLKEQFRVRGANRSKKVKRVEWVIQDMASKKMVYERGEGVFSPEFTVNLDGENKVLKRAKLVFYPNGSTIVAKPGFCSVFLLHHMDAVEAQVGEGMSQEIAGRKQKVMMEGYAGTYTNPPPNLAGAYDEHGAIYYANTQGGVLGSDSRGNTGDNGAAAIILKKHEKEAERMKALWFRYRLTVGILLIFTNL